MRQRSSLDETQPARLASKTRQNERRCMTDFLRARRSYSEIGKKGSPKRCGRGERKNGRRKSAISLTPLMWHELGGYFCSAGLFLALMSRAICDFLRAAVFGWMT